MGKRLLYYMIRSLIYFSMLFSLVILEFILDALDVKFAEYLDAIMIMPGLVINVLIKIIFMGNIHSMGVNSILLASGVFYYVIIFAIISNLKKYKEIASKKYPKEHND